MSYVVTEMKHNNNDNYLTFGDLNPGDVFVLLDSDEISSVSALFKKEVFISSINNVTILIANNLTQIGKKGSITDNQRVAKVIGLDASLSLKLKRNKS